MVVDYRTRVLKISEEDELDTKLTRIPSAKKYKGKRPCLSCAALPLPVQITVRSAASLTAALCRHLELGVMSRALYTPLS